MKKIILCFCILFYYTGQLLYAQVPQLWGTTFYGGTYSKGNIFSISADGSNFHNILSFDDTDGANPECNFLQASNGKLYDVTASPGGAYLGGNLFSVDPITDSFENILYFSNSFNGRLPQSNLIQLDNGLIYGMTTGGGDSTFPNGVIFNFDPTNDIYTRLYEFGNCDTGCEPGGENLTQASNGKLYGLANYGDLQGNNNGGVIFSFDLSDNAYTDLYNFNPYVDTNGYNPGGSLLEGDNGILYGTASNGGVYGGGVIFTFNPSTNTYKKIFDLHDTLGIGPGGLVQLSSGKLYGTCYYGGYGDGIIFSFNPSDNSYERLYEFTGYSGMNPSGLTLASDGKLYGTTGNGAAYQQGNIFRFDPDSNTFKDIFDFSGTQGYGANGLTEYNPNTGINQLSVKSNQLIVYPNPTSGVVTISSSKNIDDVKVTNLLGQIIYTAQPKQTQFNFELRETGMFFVTVTAGGEIVTKKLVVSR